MTESPGRIIDFDSHYYEPYDCFTRHIESKFRDHAVNIRAGSDGLGRVYIGDARHAFMSVIQTDYILPPGSLRHLFDGTIDRSEVTSRPVNARDFPPFMDREARLRLMTQQGLDGACVFPSLGVGVEHELRGKPDALYANLRSFNRWVEDDWGYSYAGRIFAAPLLSLVDLDLCLPELERVLDAGARIVHLKTGPVNGRSPADPIFDPFWARVAEAAVPVAFHLDDSGYTELFSAMWGEHPHPPIHRYTPFQLVTCLGDRPIADTVASLVLGNLFGRFPDLRVVTVEQGSAWVSGLVKKMDAVYHRSRDRAGIGGPLAARPGDMFRRNVFVAPFAEEDVIGLVGLLGADRVLFGSDFPHPEGLSDPRDFEDLLADLPVADIAAVMGGNASGLLHLAPAETGAA